MGKIKIAYEAKVEIVRDYLSGKAGYKESVRRANNSKSTFQHWVKQRVEKFDRGCSKMHALYK